MPATQPETQITEVPSGGCNCLGSFFNKFKKNNLKNEKQALVHMDSGGTNLAQQLI